MIVMNFERILSYDANDLHKKTGKIIVNHPTDSDLAEGNFMAQIWFYSFNENGKTYLIKEWDVRK